MTKRTESAYGHVTPAMLKGVHEVLAESIKHTYSTSKVYGVYNDVMRTKEVPQTCGTCLRNRVRELKVWLAGYEESLKVEGVMFELADGGSLEMVEGGKVLDANGKGTKPGKYELMDGGTLYVSVGSKGRHEPAPVVELTEEPALTGGPAGCAMDEEPVPAVETEEEYTADNTEDLT